MPKQEIALLVPVLSLILPRNYGKNMSEMKCSYYHCYLRTFGILWLVFLPVLEQFHLCVSQRNLFPVDVFCQFHQALLSSLKNKALKIVVLWRVFHLALLNV